MQIFNIIKRYWKLSLLLILVLTTILLLGAVFYLDQQKAPIQNVQTASDLKGYDVLTAKLKPLLVSPKMELRSGNVIVSNLSILENKNKTAKDRYQALATINNYFTLVYSDTNVPAFRQISVDLDSFAKNNFPKFYNSKDFRSVCQDPTCAETPQPAEITQMVEEVKTGDIPDNIKTILIQGLVSPGYLPKSLNTAKAQNYYYVMQNLQNTPTASGINKKIYDHLQSFLEKNFPQEYKLILEKKL